MSGPDDLVGMERARRLGILGSLVTEPDPRTLLARIPDGFFPEADEQALFDAAKAVLAENGAAGDAQEPRFLQIQAVLTRIGGVAGLAVPLVAESASYEAGIDSALSEVARLRPAWEKARAAKIVAGFLENGGGESVDKLTADLRAVYGAGKPDSLIASDWNALELRHAKLPKPPSLLGQKLLKKGSLAMLFGQPGLGKSWLSFQLALSIARGEEFMGLPTSQGNTVIFSLEDPPDEIEDRLAAVAEFSGGDRGLEYIYVVPREGLRTALDLGKREHVESLVEYANKRHASLIVLDAMSRCHLSDENDNAQMGAIIAASDELRIRSGACVLFFHHERKPAEGKKSDPIDAYKSRGASAILGAIRTQLQLVKHRSGLLQLATTKSNYSPKGDDLLWLAQSVHGPLRRVPAPEESKDAMADNIATLRAWTAEQSDEFTAADAMSALTLLTTAGEKVAERTVRKYLSVLLSAGELKCNGSTRDRRFRHSARC